MMNYQNACPTFAISAVDVHAHFGLNCPKGVDKPEPHGNGDAEVVAQRARRSNIRWTIVSPLKALYPEGQGDVLEGNREAAEVVERIPGLLQWAVLSPLTPESFDQVSDLVQSPRCAGIKIHPEMHKYHIKDQGHALFEFAARHDQIITTHSGESLSLPEDFVPFADAFPEVRLIVAHLGCSCDGDLTHQVRAVQMSKHGNIYIDTSSAMNITPDLLEYAVSEVGAERLLFGTDTPVYVVPMQRARVDWAEIAEEDKRKILNDNAVALLGDIVA